MFATIPQPQVVTPKWPENFQPVTVPPNSNSLFWSVTLALLLPLLNNKSAFNKACGKLFGTEPINLGRKSIKVGEVEIQQKIHTLLNTYDCKEQSLIQFRTTFLEPLVSEVFRARVVDLMDKKFDSATKKSILEESNLEAWFIYENRMRKAITPGDLNTVRAISLLLEIEIQVFNNNICHKYAHLKTGLDNKTIYLKFELLHNNYSFGLSDQIYQALIKTNLETDLDPDLDKGNDRSGKKCVVM